MTGLLGILKHGEGKGNERVLRLLKKTKGEGKNASEPRLSKNISRLVRLKSSTLKIFV